MSMDIFTLLIILTILLRLGWWIAFNYAIDYINFRKLLSTIQSIQQKVPDYRVVWTVGELFEFCETYNDHADIFHAYGKGFYRRTIFNVIGVDLIISTFAAFIISGIWNWQTGLSLFGIWWGLTLVKGVLTMIESETLEELLDDLHFWWNTYKFRIKNFDDSPA